MPDREKIIKGLEFTKAMITFNPSTGEDIEPEDLNEDNKITYDACVGAIALLKEQEAVQPKTIPEELKQKMWNALYTEEGKFEKKYVGAEEDGWFFIYRPWLQKGFNLAIKAIADWEER